MLSLQLAAARLKWITVAAEHNGVFRDTCETLRKAGDIFNPLALAPLEREHVGRENRVWLVYKVTSQFDHLNPVCPTVAKSRHRNPDTDRGSGTEGLGSAKVHSRNKRFALWIHH